MAPSRHLPGYVTQSEEARLHFANPRVGCLFFDTPNSRTPPLLLASIDFTRTHQELRVVSVRNGGPRGRTVITWQTFLPAPLPCAWLPCRNGWPPAPYHFHPPFTLPIFLLPFPASKTSAGIFLATLMSNHSLFRQCKNGQCQAQRDS